MSSALVIRDCRTSDRETAHRLLTAQLLEHGLAADAEGIAAQVASVKLLVGQPKAEV